jgi:hypothetical protein
MYAMRNPSHACGVDFFIGIVFLHIMRSFYFSSISSFKYLLHYNAFAPLLFPQLVGCEFSNLCFLHHSIFFCLVSDTLCVVVVSRNTIFCSGLGLCLSSFSVFPIVLCCLQNIIGAPHEYYMSVRSLRPSSEGHQCS